jgi:hypothetical protein
VVFFLPAFIHEISIDEEMSIHVVGFDPFVLDILFLQILFRGFVSRNPKPRVGIIFVPQLRGATRRAAERNQSHQSHMANNPTTRSGLSHHAITPEPFAF